MKTKYIFVTGGVCSALGKGLAAASLGALLEARGFSVAMQKMDPYLNVDPGTMSPFQHGEVFVTSDGFETDLDLGNYERFTHAIIRRENSITTGQIYQRVIENERKGVYLGRTVQVIPHVTNEIKNSVKTVAHNSKADIVIVEIGGTVGDIESVPFLEAIRQFSSDEGKENVLYLHLTLVFSINPDGELKTKPTQHSVKALQGLGIQPDILLCRMSEPMPAQVKEKLSLFCNLPKEAIIAAHEVEHSIYEIPIIYSKQGFDEYVVKKLELENRPPDLSKWEQIIDTIKSPKNTPDIAIIGKYVEVVDAYKSLSEAILHGAIANGSSVNIALINAGKIISDNAEEMLGDFDGIVIAGGFGERGIDGKIEAIQFSRENNIPTLGICLGMQLMAIEFARNIAGLRQANTTEVELNTPDPIISLLEEQKGVTYMGGSMRLGEYEMEIFPDTLFYKIHKQDTLKARHRHRYEFNNEYKETLTSNGMMISAVCVERNLVEVIEYPAHPWYIGVQCHPEFTSKPTDPNPLFIDFIRATIERMEMANV